MSRKWLILIGVVVVFGLVLPVDAGWVMSERNGDSTLISRGRMKNVSKEFSWIMDGPGNEMIFYNSARKIYARGTVEDYCTSISSMMKEAMEGIPDEQRQMMVQMMAKSKPGSPHTVSVVKAGAGEVVAGFKTEKYKVTVEDELYEELWLNSDSALMKDFKSLMPMLQKFSSCTAGLGMMETSPENSPEYLRLMQSGIVLKSVRYEGGNPEKETDIMKLEKRSIPDQEFKAPAGYRKLSFAEMMGSQMKME
ncbi:MAG: DUF4412 domain-containing protein [Deltaproteobacteria bacterium]|nr:MAG: DUF4412 domain-containing protein [Deltaproteobacteria bacterium]